MFSLPRATSLLAVSQYGTVSAAAAALHMTSSALSQQLAKLEHEIGQPLLTRRGRGVELTDAGALLADHTAEILERMNRAQAALQAHRGEVSGRLSIAAFATATRAILPAALRSLHSDYTLLEVESHELEPTQAISGLVRGDVDIAVIDEWFRPEPDLPDSLASAHLIDDVADLAVPAEHALATAPGHVELNGCTDETWISWLPGEFGHEWLCAELGRYQPGLRFPHTAGEHQTILALVEAGLGIALMPRLGRGSVPERVVIKPLLPKIIRRCFVVWRQDRARRPAITAAVDALSSAARAVDLR
jgi:DNA-binding transcriptional LysR family regulator